MYSLTILRIAVITSFKYVGLLVCIIGIPIFYFNGELNIIIKTGLFFGLLIFFWSVYSGFCFMFHRMSLRENSNLEHYLKLSDAEKGKEIGSYFEGW
ncbi:hypothetical protein SOPP22_12525 [Shewanella sp. OPT22]|nr:hypothetical protein SOPP22_12525 [Shewanella sp. OPT22]